MSPYSSAFRQGVHRFFHYLPTGKNRSARRTNRFTLRFSGSTGTPGSIAQTLVTRLFLCKGVFDAMYDALPNPNTALRNQAKELEQAQDYAGAAEIYKQMYTKRFDESYAASHYINCLRKLHRSQEALDFGRSLSK